MLCAVPDGPADRFRIAPAFMADRDAERQRTGLENAPPGARRIGALLGGIDLDFVLEAGDRSVSIDDQRGGQQRAVDDAFGAENDRDVAFRGGRGDGGPGAFEERRVGRRHPLARRPVAGHEAFRKADDVGALDGRFGDGLFGQT